MNYQDIVAIWQSKQIKTAADIACEMNGNGVAFIYHSAKIENDRITYHDTREIFDHGGVTGYTGDVRSLFEIQNSVAAYDTLRYQKGERPGVYKKNDYVTGVQEVGALPEDVPEELSELASELEDIRPEQALTAAAYYHAKFENIHPFADGNGRAGRLLMNYLLLLLDHPPVIIHAEDRRAYYNALEQFDSDQKLDSLVDFLKSQTVKTWQARFERGRNRT